MEMFNNKCASGDDSMYGTHGPFHNVPTGYKKQQKQINLSK